MKRLLFLLSLLAIITSSCTKQLTDFTILSTKYSSLGNGESNVVKAQQAVKGKSSKLNHFLFIPTGSPDMKKAIENALQQCPGAIGLANGNIKMKSWSCLFFGKSTCYVEGTPIYDANSYQYQNNNYNQPYQYQGESPQRQYQQPNQYNSTSTYGSSSNDNYQYDNSNDDSNPYSEEDHYYHQVKQGETLQSIAESYEVTVKELIRWNNLKSNSIKAGQNIKIILK